MKLTRILLSALGFALASGYAQAAYLLVNVWDGAEISIVRKMYQENRLPNLKALGQLGQLTSVIPCYDKRCQEGVTRDQHATLLTGVDASKHKIWRNGSLNAIPSGLTLYEKLRNRIPGIKLAQIGKCELFGRNTLANTLHVMDFFEDCSPTTQQIYMPSESIHRVLELINQWKNEENWMIFVNFPDPDITGHQKGIASAEYRAALVKNDKLLGDMVQALPGNAEVFVIGDHGFGSLSLDTGRAKPYGHDSHTPGTILVRRGVQTRQTLYTNQLFPEWLSIFSETTPR